MLRLSVLPPISIGLLIRGCQQLLEEVAGVLGPPQQLGAFCDGGSDNGRIGAAAVPAMGGAY